MHRCIPRHRFLPLRFFRPFVSLYVSHAISLLAGVVIPRDLQVLPRTWSPTSPRLSVVLRCESAGRRQRLGAPSRAIFCPASPTSARSLPAFPATSRRTTWAPSTPRKSSTLVRSPPRTNLASARPWLENLL